MAGFAQSTWTRLRGAGHPWLGSPGITLGGAIIMFTALTGNTLDSVDKRRIERIETANAHLTAKKAELEATQRQLTQSLNEGLEAQEHNTGVIAELNRVIEKTRAECECSVPEEFTDALQSLR